MGFPRVKHANNKSRKRPQNREFIHIRIIRFVFIHQKDARNSFRRWGVCGFIKARSKEEMRENEIVSRAFLIDVSAIGSDAFGQNSSRNTLQNSPSGPESKLAGAQLDATC